jgi:phosphoglycerate dehydrogenase-like enzyme
VAEHAIAQMLALAKSLHIAVRYQQQRKWAQDEMWMEDVRRRPREIADATLLVVGLGAIGSKIAEHARALGMYVIATREHPERGAGAANEVHASGELHSLLQRADFVVIAAPVTGETRAIIDAEALATMKETAHLVNVSRGALVDEVALIEALRERKIAGAALDVFVKEPLPHDSGLWELDNVLITPHTAGFTERVWERHYALFRDNFERFLTGAPMLGVVDKHRGY